MSYLDLDKNKPLEIAYQTIPKTYKSNNFRDITMLLEDEMLLSSTIQYSLENDYSYKKIFIQLEISCINPLSDKEKLYKINYVNYNNDDFGGKCTFGVSHGNLWYFSKQIAIKIIEDFESMKSSEFRRKYLLNGKEEDKLYKKMY